MARLALFFLVASAALAPAHALESPWLAGAQADARLVADRAVNAPIRAGIEIRLKPGWKTYWRYPGDAGVPPRFDWSGSENLAEARVEWPAPERFVDESGAQSIGYHGQILFPVAVRPADPAAPVRLKLKLDFAVCQKLCVPAEAELALEVPARVHATLDLIDRAERRVPRRAVLGEKVGDLAITRVELERGATPHVIVEGTAPEGAFDLFAEGPDDRWSLPLPEKIESKDGKRRFRLAIDGAPPGGPLIPPKLVLTLVSEAAAIEVTAPFD